MWTERAPGTQKPAIRVDESSARFSLSLSIANRVFQDDFLEETSRVEKPVRSIFDLTLYAPREQYRRNAVAQRLRASALLFHRICGSATRYCRPNLETPDAESTTIERRKSRRDLHPGSRAKNGFPNRLLMRNTRIIKTETYIFEA